MPLLGMETHLFPETLFEGDSGAQEHAWWVLRTRPRTEKALARTFLAAEVPFFLPLHKKQWRSRGRLVSSHLPIFPGYIFIRHSNVWSACPHTNHVVQALKVNDQPRLQADLRRVYLVTQAGVVVAMEEHLHPGTPVSVVGGPLAGLQGRVLKQGKQTRFVVEVDFIQKGISVEVEGWMLRPLGEASPESRRTATEG